MEIEKYIHHGREVSVFSDLKGKHAQHCLCYAGCKRFIPNDREMNCHIASSLFDLDVKYGVTTPVFECEAYINE